MAAGVAVAAAAAAAAAADTVAVRAFNAICRCVQITCWAVLSCRQTLSTKQVGPFDVPDAVNRCLGGAERVTTFHCVSLPVHCFAWTSHCFPLTSHCPFPWPIAAHSLGALNAFAEPLAFLPFC